MNMNFAHNFDSVKFTIPALTILGLLPGLAYSQAAPQPGSPLMMQRVELAKQKAAGAEAIRIMTMVQGIKSWPKLSIEGQPQSACCVPGATRKVSVQAIIEAELPKGTAKTTIRKFESKYAVPSCWTIEAVSKTTQTVIGPASSTQDVVPAAYAFNSSKLFSTETQTLKNYILTINIPDVVKADISLKLEEFAKNYEAYASSMAVSNSSIIHTATLAGAGKLNGRTAYHAYFESQEKCCPPQLYKPEAFASAMRVWIDKTVSTYRDLGIGAVNRPADSQFTLKQ